MQSILPNSPALPTQILLVEDSEADKVLLVRVLKKADYQFELTHVSTGPEMAQALARQNWDIVISDYSLPGFSALEALKVLRARDEDTSFVVISGAVGEEIAVEVMRAGAADFIIKSGLSRLPFVIDRELKEANQRRARRAAEMGLQLSQDELKQALIAAQAASELKTSFLANMSHEIRTPIGAILGYAELASELPVPSESNLPTYLQAIRRNGEHLLGLIGDLLDLTKIESDRLETENVIFDLKREIQSVLYAAGPSAKSKNLELHADLSQLFYTHLISDPTRFKQILINVVGNAVKFTEHGEIRISVSQAENAGVVTTRFEVRDTGLGLSVEQVSRLFEPFMQGDASTSRKFGGTGLGLSLSRRLARHLGGDLRLLNTQTGVGSTFEISFCARLATHSSHIEKPQSMLRTEGKLKGFRVLLVEDSPDNQVIVQRFLAPTGVAIEIAGNGEEAIEKVAGQEYGLILMDLQLPLMDGHQATRILRENGLRIPIIALTAHAFKGAREQALNDGFSDYLTKPIDRAKLTETLFRYLIPSVQVQ